MRSRISPFTGVLAVVLFVVAFIVTGETPDFDESGQEVIDFYADDEGAQFLGSALLGWGAIALVFFGNFLRGVLRRAEPESGGISAVVFGGAIIAAMGVASFASFNFALADAADEETFEPAAAQALNILNGDFFFPLAIGFSAFFIAAAVAVLKHGGLARWLGWVALVIGIVCATPLGFFAFLAGLVWILVVSVLSATRRDEREETAPPSALPG